MAAVSYAHEGEVPARVWLQATHPIAELDVSDPWLLEAFAQVIRATYHATRASSDRATNDGA